MSALLPFLIVGFVTGSLYGLAGVGLVLTYRTSGVFNFGHGALAAAAAYIFYTLHVTHGMAWPLAALVSVLGFGVLAGMAIEFMTRRLVGAPEALVTVATVGLLLVQVTTRSASTRPRESRTVATSRIVSPTARVAAVGAMVTDATGGGGAIESVPQAATRTTPALSARRMFIGRNLEARAGRWVAE